MKLEIVTTTCDETIQVHQAGADRVELVSGITEGALTPTFGSLKGIKDHTQVPAYCMIRPHNHGFVYSDFDIEEMIADITNQQGLADVFVLGCLTTENEIDEVNLAKLVAACKDTPVVFHKAFDLVQDQEKALDILSQYPTIQRVLSNYQASSVEKELPRIQEMMEYAKSKGIETTFAGGIKLETIPYLVSIGATDVHISSAARVDGLAKNKVDSQKVREFRIACDKI